jgi:hypothetical protein
MTTFLANTLTETALSDDKRRFEMTFVDADGRPYTISIPSTIAAELVPVLEQVASHLGSSAAELTRIPKECAVGHAIRERKVLLRFDDEPPYALGVEEAEALGRELQEQTEFLATTSRPALH